jgi:hypothetical protein
MLKIDNHELLTRIFGKWPSFHDAEVLSLRLERSGNSHDDGPVLEGRDPNHQALRWSGTAPEMPTPKATRGFHNLEAQ